MWAIGKKEECVVKESIGSNIGKVVGLVVFFQRIHVNLNLVCIVRVPKE